MEGILDVDKSLTRDSEKFDIGGTTTHGRWSYGSASVTGTYLCTVEPLQSRLGPSVLSERKIMIGLISGFSNQWALWN